MKAVFAAGALAVAALAGLSGCAGMSTRDKNIAGGGNEVGKR